MVEPLALTAVRSQWFTTEWDVSLLKRPLIGRRCVIRTGAFTAGRQLAFLSTSLVKRTLPSLKWLLSLTWLLALKGLLPRLALNRLLALELLLALNRLSSLHGLLLALNRLSALNAVERSLSLDALTVVNLATAHAPIVRRCDSSAVAGFVSWALLSPRIALAWESLRQVVPATALVVDPRFVGHPVPPAAIVKHVAPSLDLIVKLTTALLFGLTLARLIEPALLLTAELLVAELLVAQLIIAELLIA